MYCVEMELHDMKMLTGPGTHIAAKIAAIRIAQAETHTEAEGIIERINAKNHADMPRIMRLKLALRAFYGSDRDIAVVYTKRPL